jgi:hypothetical protein
MHIKINAQPVRRNCGGAVRVKTGFGRDLGIVSPSFARLIAR